jgi:diguanylate cyclase (GGDEF)-like protein
MGSTLNPGHNPNDGDVALNPAEASRWRIAQLESLLRRSRDEQARLEAHAADFRLQLENRDAQWADIQKINLRLARANAESAELMAELEERNRSLKEANLALARANAHGAELMATIQIKEDEIQRLNRSLSGANATAAELVAERELQLEEMDRLNKNLRKEVLERKKAEESAADLALQLARANQNLDRLATIDALTEVLNRRGIDRQLTAELSRAARGGHAIGVIFVDFDDFKSVNERFGHVGGDVALQDIARRLMRSLRNTDCLGRIGGDEFMAVIPDVARPELAIMAERFRAAAADTPMTIAGQEVTVTLSLAAAVLSPDTSSLDEILSQVKDGLATSKKLGKNRVTMVG